MNSLANSTEQNQLLNKKLYRCVATKDIQNHVYIVQLGIIAILPILILTSCNITIITQLLRQNKKLMTMECQTDGRQKSTRLFAAAMTARTIAISITQCFTAIPIVSMDIYTRIFISTSETIYVMYYVCNTIYYVNNAINVVFYCLLGKSFRQDCWDIFKRKPKYDIHVRGEVRPHATVETVSSSVLSSVM